MFLNPSFYIPLSLFVALGLIKSGRFLKSEFQFRPVVEADDIVPFLCGHIPVFLHRDVGGGESGQRAGFG